MTQLPLDLPPTFDELCGKTQCAMPGCDAMVAQCDKVIGCIRIGATTHQEHFCSFECRDAWRDYMRPGGL